MMTEENGNQNAGNPARTASRSRVGFGARLAVLLYAYFAWVLFALFTIGAGWFVWWLVVVQIESSGSFARILIAAGAINVWYVAISYLFKRIDRQSDSIKLQREDAPLLFSFVEAAATASGCARPDEITIDRSFGAYAVEVPQRIFPPRSVSRIGLGLPLLSVLSPEQAAAVICHEIAHLRNRDSRLERHVTYARNLVEQILHDDERMGDISNAVSLPLVAVYRLYWEGLTRLEAKMSREQEFLADALAADIVGARVAAEALVALRTLGEHGEEEINKPLDESWEKGDAIPDSFLQAMTDRIHGTVIRSRLEGHLARALERETGKFDTHPCLKDRLAALGISASLPEFDPVVSAAKAFFGDNLEAIAEKLEARFREIYAEAWKSRAKEVEAARAWAKKSRLLMEARQQDAEARTIHGFLLNRHLPASETIDEHRQLLTRFPGLAPSRFAVAAHGLRQGSVECLDTMLDIIESDALLQPDAAELIIDLFNNPDQLDAKAKALCEKLQDESQIARLSAAMAAYHAVAERQPDGNDYAGRISQPGLADWHRRMIAEEFAEFESVRLVWIAKARQELPGALPHYFILLQNHGDELDFHPHWFMRRLCLPGSWDSGIFERKALKKASPCWRAIAAMPEALIYEASNMKPLRRAA